LTAKSNIVISFSPAVTSAQEENSNITYLKSYSCRLETMLQQ
jgi:hypothetical protein